MKLTHRNIEVFYTLMTTKTTTLASKVLHSSQPTISRELARIEQVAGFKLFERINGRLVPNQRAYTLFEEVKTSYIGLERISNSLKSLKEKSYSEISIIAEPTFANSLIPQACSRFKSRNIHANISLQFDESPFLERKLSNQLFDIGLTERLEAPPDTRLETIFASNEVCILPDGHKLLKKQRIDFSDFENEEFISFSPNDPYRLKLDQQFSEENIHRNHIIETSSATSLCCLVSLGLGIGIVNPLIALEFSGRGINIRPITFSHSFAVSVITPSFKATNPLVEEFISDLKEQTYSIEQTLN